MPSPPALPSSAPAQGACSCLQDLLWSSSGSRGEGPISCLQQLKGDQSCLFCLPYQCYSGSDLGIPHQSKNIMYYIVFFISTSGVSKHSSDTQFWYLSQGERKICSSFKSIPYSSFQEDLSEQAFLQKEDFFFFPQKLIKKVFQGGEVLPVACWLCFHLPFPLLPRHRCSAVTGTALP